MLSGFMINAWEAATILGVVAGVVGFFTVLRGSAFAAHAIPNGAFAGAAGAALIGVNAIVGLGAFSLLGALGIGALGRRARRDVATALAIVVMLGLGALFLSMTTEYAPEIYALLFGEVLGVSTTELVPTAIVAVVSIAAVVALYRPLMLSTVAPDVAAARGVSGQRMEVCFLLVIALTASAAVPVVGTLLTFSLLISPAAAARSFTARPGVAMALSVVISLVIVWSAIAVSFVSNLPVGFFVGTFGALSYATGRAWRWWQDRGTPGPGATAPGPAAPGAAAPGPAAPGAAAPGPAAPGPAAPGPAAPGAAAPGPAGHGQGPAILPTPTAASLGQ